MRIHFIKYCLSIFVLSCSMGENGQVTESESRQLAGNWPNAVSYEIFVQSFFDTNGDGIGDLDGVSEKLDYLNNLGVEAIWLMPINPSPSYHKYDVMDYQDIHEDYGTLDDFRELVSKAHDRNIKVIIDLVINHTSRAHPWFQEAIKNPDSKYRDYYVWANKDSVEQLTIKEELEDDSDNPIRWHPIEGDEQLYYGYFWGGMPDLNFDNPSVKQEIYEIAKFWLMEMDVDGFRLDAAKHIFADDRAGDNHQWWISFRNELSKVKPNIFLLGEVWSDAEEVAPYLEGLPALFNFDIGKAIIQAVRGEQTGNLLSKHYEIQKFYRSINPDYVDATFITNHDQNRVASEVNGDKNKVRMAAGLLMTLPGSPFIYYGEELGMLGQKPDEHIREPFNWVTDSANSGEASWIQAKYSTDTSVPALELQLKDSLSLYNHYKKLIQLRNDHPVLTYGNLELLTNSSEAAVCSFLRIHEQDTAWIAHNLSKNKRVVEIPHCCDNLIPLFSNGNYSIDSIANSIILPPYTSVILKN